ncbi:hypothetical protein OCU04_009667 [Sclerotinia nivalis]|uniref:Uncharacterized protein n=1 Tax=Sclerotinia nivalis TaxID=352851 RepID=A0A9X0DFQ8_9HELO|nr:hypothetical protein OCU04_009667 [Sclerotinia nivalis]
MLNISFCTCESSPIYLLFLDPFAVSTSGRKGASRPNTDPLFCLLFLSFWIICGEKRHPYRREVKCAANDVSQNREYASPLLMNESIWTGRRIHDYTECNGFLC